MRTKQKHYSEAERLFDKMLSIRMRKFGDDHPDTLESKNDLAVLYIKMSEYDKAEPLLVKAVEGRRLKLGDTHPHTVEFMNNLIALYETWNKPEEAEEWRAKLTKTEAGRERHNPPNTLIFLLYKESEYLDKSCHQNDTTNLDFSLMSADKYQVLS